jgi:uncharacterized membrane protein
MDEGNKNSVKLAPWLVTVSAMLLIAIMGFTVRGSVRVAKTETHVENNTKDIDDLKVNKANQEKMDDTYDAILRLEKKFDKYILEN